MNQVQDWRYRYSASGEREQKRLVYTSAWDSLLPYPWMYYALGGSNEQLAVYHGQQTSGTGMCGDSGRRVYLYPTEYLTYGNGDAINVLTDPVGAKNYKIADHLGSTRLMVSAGGSSGQSNYEPFGGKDAVTGDRKAYIDKEKDKETSLHNFGVRSFDDDEGRFLSVDPKWEKFRGWSPYDYADNNPLGKRDPAGESAIGGNATSVGGGHNEMNPQDYYDVTAPEEGGGARGGGGTAGRISVGEAWGRFWKRIAGGGGTQPPLAPPEGGPKSTPPEAGEPLNVKATANGKRASQPFTRAGKAVVYERNAAVNEGVNKCENCAVETVKPQKSMKGVTPFPQESQVDHRMPRSVGGDGSPSNGGILCRECNGLKSDMIQFNQGNARP